MGDPEESRGPGFSWVQPQQEGCFTSAQRELPVAAKAGTHRARRFQAARSTWPSRTASPHSEAISSCRTSTGKYWEAMLNPGESPMRSMVAACCWQQYRSVGTSEKKCRKMCQHHRGLQATSGNQNPKCRRGGGDALLQRGVTANNSRKQTKHPCPACTASPLTATALVNYAVLAT